MADEPRDDADTLVTPPRSSRSGLYGGGTSESGMGGTVKLIVAGLVVGFGIKWAMDHFSSKKGAPADHNTAGKYLTIPGTTVVMGDGSTHTGAARYFNADVAVNALRNLLALYDYAESTQKPLVGDHFARITHIAEGAAPPAVGMRAFDWLAQASKLGFFVVMPAASTSGPWSAAEGNNVMIAVKPEDLPHSDILDEWAVVVEPHMLLPSDMSTASLDAYLTGAKA